MKNIHLIPTEEPSRLYSWNGSKVFDGGLRLRKSLGFCDCNQSNTVNQNIYITNSEEIKEGDISYYPPFGVGKNIIIDLDHIEGVLCFHIPTKNGKGSFTQKTSQTLDINKKIILTDNKDLIYDGVQSIDDEFLEWFVKNPSCEEVEVKHKDVIQYGNMTMYDHNGDGSHYFCTDCEVETSRSKEELLKFGVELYKILIPKEEPKTRVFGTKNDKQFWSDKPKQLQEAKQETLEEAAEIDLTRLCYYDRRNPDFQIKEEYGYDKEEVEATGNFAKKDCACDNCFYGRSKLTEQLLWQQERMYSEEEVIDLLTFVNDRLPDLYSRFSPEDELKEWFEQNKKK